MNVPGMNVRAMIGVAAAVSVGAGVLAFRHVDEHPEANARTGLGGAAAMWVGIPSMLALGTLAYSHRIPPAASTWGGIAAAAVGAAGLGAFLGTLAAETNAAEHAPAPSASSW